MFGRRRSAGDRGRDLVSQAADEATETEETAVGEAQVQATGPWDVAEPHPELPRVDLGSLQVPVLEGTDIQLVFAEQHGAWVTVRHQLSELQLQAFAAPKRSGLWDEVRGEIATEIGGTSGQSAEREGPFGTELVAHVPAEQGQPASGMRPIRFVGVDGPRWFLRGLFAGAAAADPRRLHRSKPCSARSSSSAASTRCRRATCLSSSFLRRPRPPSRSRPGPSREQAEQAEEQQNRFATAPNPFQRGPEMTETR